MTFFITIDPDDDSYWTNHPTYSKARKNEDVGLDIPNTIYRSYSSKC